MPDGTEITGAAENGQNLMQAALSHDVPGIIGECGGTLSCATCHVYVDPA
ncbi:2Fe-2S iron-sulfur cluster-binding protein [Phaeobacter gallaeciensis]